MISAMATAPTTSSSNVPTEWPAPNVPFIARRAQARHRCSRRRATCCASAKKFPCERKVAAVDDGLAAMEKLLAQLADVPTPAGPTARQLQAQRLVQLETKPISTLNEGA